MKFTRRQCLALGTLGIPGIGSSFSRANAAVSSDGIGPNRGINSRTIRGKQTCTNTDVAISDTGSRISAPEDFGRNSCQLIKDSFEGPYFVCTPATGKDIAIDQSGQPLTIAMRLVDADCNPIPNGVVDIWACNADGFYAGYSNNPDKRPPMLKAMLFGHLKPDAEERFCRGALRTDADGISEFNSIYPGYYYGQPVHVHFKVHVDGKNMLTSQANFPENWNERIMKQTPYNKSRAIQRNTSQTRFSNMHMIERADRLLAVLDLTIPN